MYKPQISDVDEQKDQSYLHSKLNRVYIQAVIETNEYSVLINHNYDIYC